MSTSRVITHAVRALVLCVSAVGVACDSGSSSRPGDEGAALPESERPVSEPVDGEPIEDAAVGDAPVGDASVADEPDMSAAGPSEVEHVEPPPRLPIVIGDQPGDARCLQLTSETRGFGQVSEHDWEQWLGSARFANGSEFLEVPDRGQGIPELRQQFVPASNGSPRVIVGSDLPPARTYRLVQSLYFEDGWDWGGDSYQGGKIGFGLSGGTSPTGGTIDPAGFSARLMWRGNFDGTARMVIYSYAADRSGSSGENVTLGEFLAPIGEWFELAMEIQANSDIHASDGRMRAWANGHLVLDRGGVAWQTAGNVPMVDNLYYASFYGGNTPQWSPDHPTYARVRDACWAAVVDGYSGIDPDVGRLVVNGVAGSGTPSYDATGSPLPADTYSRGVSDSLEAASATLSTMIEMQDQSAAENPMLLQADAMLHEAHRESLGLDLADRGQRTRTVAYLHGALDLVRQSIDLRKQRDQPADVELSLSAELSRISARLTAADALGSNPE